jgi:Purple acid Phosphatase, N-terminal domain
MLARCINLCKSITLCAKGSPWLTGIGFACGVAVLAACCLPASGKPQSPGDDDCAPASEHRDSSRDKDDHDRDHRRHDRDDDDDHDRDDHRHGKPTSTKCSVSTGTSTGTKTATGTNTATATKTGTSASTSTGTAAGEYNFPNMPGRVCHVDRFRQAPAPQALKKVDVLFVMDHSGSMSAHWQKVAGNIENMVKQLPRDADIRYGVILGDVGYWRGKLYAPSKVPVILDNQKLSDQQIASYLQQTFAAAMKVTDVGQGEALFNSLQSAVTDHGTENQKLGFFRPDAALSILFMSDENEIGVARPANLPAGTPPKCDSADETQIRQQYYVSKGISTDSAFNAVKALKGDMPVKTSAFVEKTLADLWVDNSPKASCIYDMLGYGYFEMVAKTNGLLFSIQDKTENGLTQLGKVTNDAMALQHDFTLSQPATKVDPATILAAVDGSQVASTYNAAADSVHIDNSGAANSLVEIGYCEPAVNQPPVWSLGSVTGTPAQTSVALQWTTPGYATAGRVLWGTSASALSNSVDDANTTANHGVTVSGLAPNTVYYFQVVSWDGFGQTQQSAVLSFRTLPQWSISALVGQPSATTVSLQWSTAAYATKGYILWGTSAGSLSNQVNDAAVATNHSVVVSGLAPNTTYYFQAFSSDEFGQQQSTQVIAVTTLINWGIMSFSGNAGVSTVNLNWATPELATSGQILWGTSASALTNVMPDSAVATAHNVVVSGLSPNTDYYFQAVSTDSTGLQKSSGVLLLHTLTDWSVSNFAGVPTVNSVSLSWVTSGYNTTGKVLWGTSSTALNNVANDSVTGVNHSVNVTGLNSSTTYYFQAVSDDNQGLERSSPVVAITTLSALPVWTLQNFAGSATDTTVTLTWSTPEYATSGQVLWGSSQSSLTNSANDSGVLNNHSVTISGLSPNTVYYFQAVSTDDKGQSQSSVVIPVTTLSSPNPPPPPQNWTVQGFDGTTTGTTATIIWQTPGVPTKATLLVGTDPANLTLQSIDVPAYSASQIVTVSGLSVNTTYYFQVIAVDQSGKTVDSVILNKTTKAQ